MRYIGNYKDYKCFEASRIREIPQDNESIYIYSVNGNMYFDGAVIGRVDVNTYKVLEFNLEKHLEEKEKKKKKQVAEVPVPACVAESTTIGTEIAEGMDLCGTDEFFARVAKDIDEMLKNVGKFGND